MTEAADALDVDSAFDGEANAVFDRALVAFREERRLVRPHAYDLSCLHHLGPSDPYGRSLRNVVEFAIAGHRLNERSLASAPPF